MGDPRRALVLIDVQREYVDGELPVRFPPLDAALAAIGAAAAAAGLAGATLVLVRHDDGEDAPAFATGSRGADLAAPAADLDADAVVTKHGVSAFHGTPLAGLLAERGVDTVTLAGFLTHVCIESTARDAADRGFAVEVLSDATGTVDIVGADAATVHTTSLAVLGSAFAAVVTTERWIAALEDRSGLEPPDLLANARAATGV